MINMSALWQTGDMSRVYLPSGPVTAGLQPSHNPELDMWLRK